jgi:hypothetical protein
MDKRKAGFGGLCGIIMPLIDVFNGNVLAEKAARKYELL